MKKCKYCKQDIDAHARVCHHCQRYQCFIWNWVVLGGLLVVFVAGIFSIIPFERWYKEASWNDSIEIISANTLGRCIFQNTGDGDVFITDMLFQCFINDTGRVVQCRAAINSVVEVGSFMDKELASNPISQLEMGNIIASIAGELMDNPIDVSMYFRNIEESASYSEMVHFSDSYSRKRYPIFFKTDKLVDIIDSINDTSFCLQKGDFATEYISGKTGEVKTITMECYVIFPELRNINESLRRLPGSIGLFDRRIFDRRIFDSYHFDK